MSTYYYKQIPTDFISQKPFTMYKSWTFDQTNMRKEIPIYSATKTNVNTFVQESLTPPNTWIYDADGNILNYNYPLVNTDYFFPVSESINYNYIVSGTVVNGALQGYIDNSRATIYQDPVAGQITIRYNDLSYTYTNGQKIAISGSTYQKSMWWSLWNLFYRKANGQAPYYDIASSSSLTQNYDVTRVFNSSSVAAIYGTQFRSGSMPANAFVYDIPKRYFGEKIKPGTFAVRGTTIYAPPWYWTPEILDYYDVSGSLLSSGTSDRVRVWQRADMIHNGQGLQFSSVYGMDEVVYWSGSDRWGNYASRPVGQLVDPGLFFDGITLRSYGANAQPFHGMSPAVSIEPPFNIPGYHSSSVPQRVLSIPWNNGKTAGSWAVPTMSAFFAFKWLGMTGGSRTDNGAGTYDGMLLGNPSLIDQQGYHIYMKPGWRMHAVHGIGGYVQGVTDEADSLFGLQVTDYPNIYFMNNNGAHHDGYAPAGYWHNKYDWSVVHQGSMTFQPGYNMAYNSSSWDTAGGLKIGPAPPAPRYGYWGMAGFNALVHEILVVGDNMTDDEFDKAQAYFAWKWSSVNYLKTYLLQPANPYYNAPPMLTQAEWDKLRRPLDYINIVDDGYGNLFDTANPTYISPSQSIGNISYDLGLVIITNPNYVSVLSASYYEYASGSLAPFVRSTIPPYNGSPAALTLAFTSSYTVYENEYICIARANEFNYTDNRTAYTADGHWKFSDVQASGSEQFDFKPFVTGIGLYDDLGNLVAYGKINTPVRMENKLDTVFVVNFDT